VKLQMTLRKKNCVKVLEEYLSEEATRRELYEAARYLWEPISEEWQAWLSKKYMATIAAALRQAMESLCPDLDVSSLAIDLDQYNSISDPTADEIWIRRLLSEE